MGTEYQVHGGDIAVITLANPPVNGLGLSTRQGIASGLDRALADDAVRAIVTRYDGGQQAELAGLMQAYLGRTLSPWRQDFTALGALAVQLLLDSLTGDSAGGLTLISPELIVRESTARCVR